MCHELIGPKACKFWTYQESNDKWCGLKDSDEGLAARPGHISGDSECFMTWFKKLNPTNILHKYNNYLVFTMIYNLEYKLIYLT